MSFVNQIVKAKIQWIPPENGGRQNPPAGPRYSTVARFEDIKDKWPNEAWSIVAEFLQEKDCRQNIVNLRFLVDGGPEHLLYPGSKFDLFEGASIVAKGEVLT